MKLIIHSSGFVFWSIFTFLISACSSHVPPEISQMLEDSPSINTVRAGTDNYIAQKVRWGGVILNTENKHESSWLTIIAFPLKDNGEPIISDQSLGRFIAVVDQFLEPLVYSSERQITVKGNLLRTEIQKIGEFSYEYPVVQVEHAYLWPVLPEPAYTDYPPYWWHDPWYDPYYPYFPRPYLR